jgi:hypothetical protein
MTPIEKLEKWFAKPIVEIEKTSADAAFLVLSASFSMFERFVKSRMHTEKDALGTRRMNKDEKKAFFYKFSADILGIPDPKLFENFWDMYRNGIAHYLQPKLIEIDGKEYGWRISVGGSFKDLPEYYHDPKDGWVIRINPWRWTERVVNLWRSRPDLLDVLPQFPLAEIQTESISP